MQVSRESRAVRSNPRASVGAGLRGWMAVVAGGLPSFSWSGTFLAILLPATLVGATLGWAEHARRTGGRGAWRWTALSPLLFVVMSALVQDNFVTRLVRTGIGGAQIGVALIGIIGGYAIAGRGSRWARWLVGIETSGGDCQEDCTDLSVSVCKPIGETGYGNNNRGGVS